MKRKSILKWVSFALFLTAFFTIRAMAEEAAAATAPGFNLGAWVASQGGWMAAILAVVVCFNIAVTALKAICEKLKLKEPGWLQGAGHWGDKILGYLSANTTTPPAVDVKKQI